MTDEVRSNNEISWRCPNLKNYQCGSNNRANTAMNNMSVNIKITVLKRDITADLSISPRSVKKETIKKQQAHNQGQKTRSILSVKPSGKRYSITHKIENTAKRMALQVAKIAMRSFFIYCLSSHL